MPTTENSAGTGLTPLHRFPCGTFRAGVNAAGAPEPGPALRTGGRRAARRYRRSRRAGM